MPSHKSNWKRLRQDKVRRERNTAEKSRVRSAIKKLKQTAGEGDPEKSARELKKTFSLIDKAAKRRTLHPRTADRRKSRLQRRVNKGGG